MSLEARIAAILRSPKPGAAPQVRTSPAFAARFEAEAQRSGLDLDVGQTVLFQVCPTCGAQTSSSATSCFNCQTELQPQAQPTRVRHVPEARWRHVLGGPPASTLPYSRLPVLEGRFAPAPPAQAIGASEVLGRFLSVFVEREQAPPQSVKRFDDRTVLDKFLSVFVERS